LDEQSVQLLITGSIARSETCRYLIYSEADFEVFRPAGATRCTDWGEIWRGGGDMEEGTEGPLLHARSPPPRQISVKFGVKFSEICRGGGDRRSLLHDKFHPNRCNS